MESRQRVMKSPSTPCDRPLCSDFLFDVLEDMPPNGHEDGEIRTMTKRGSTSFERETNQLPKEEESCEKNAARYDKHRVGRDFSCRQVLFDSFAKILNYVASAVKDCGPGAQKLENELREQENALREKATQIDDLTKSLRAKDEELQGLEAMLNEARHDIRDIRDAAQKEVQGLKSNIEEKVEVLKDAELFANQLKAKCQKLDSQLALIAQKTAQESLTSGSYSDDHANPGMLEVACKAVDKTMDDLARVLYNISYLKTLPLDSVELESLLHLISTAHPADFSRAIQVRNVWGHWICCQFFQNFENVFFDLDQRHRTSPLDSKKHALECFQSFKQKKSTSSLELLNGCGNFQSFFSWKYKSMFPASLVDSGILPSGIIVNENTRFFGEGEIFDRFLDVAKAVWLLHELAFSFDPPASILRMARGEPYDKQFHDSVVHVEDGDGPSAVVALMIRPAFRVRKSIVRSRVLLTQKLP